MNLLEPFSEVFNPAQEQRVSDRKRQILTDIIEANTCKEVNSIIYDNQDFFDEHRFLYKFAHNAMKRIRNLHREKCKNTELIYKN